MIDYPLTAGQLQRAWSLAQRRNQKRADVRNRRIGRHIGDLDMNYAGVRGEMASALYLGTSFDEKIYHRGGDRHRADIVVKGARIEVKSLMSFRPEKYWHLKVPPKHPLKADWLALCYTRPRGWKIENLVGLVGAITTAEFRQRATLIDFKYSVSLAIPFTWLLSFEELKSIVTAPVTRTR